MGFQHPTYRDVLHSPVSMLKYCNYLDKVLVQGLGRRERGGSDMECSKIAHHGVIVPLRANSS